MPYTDVEWKLKKIGKNVQIAKNVYFRYPEETIIGDNVIIDEFCYFTTSLTIGNNVHIAPMCSVIGGKSSKLIMEDFSGMAAGV
ncbi:MAG: acyltransferase, partial [Spirochaetales bacterium]